MQLNFSLALGTSQTGLALQAQLVDSTNTPVGAAVTTGFYEIGAGNYLWVGTIAQGFQGGVTFSNIADGSIKAFVALNPADTTPPSSGGGGATQQSWNFNTGTAPGDPGKGKISFNAATPAASTQLFMDSLTNSNFDFANWFRSFNAGDTVTIQDSGNANNWVKYTLAAAPADQTGWWIVGVTYMASAGTLPNNNSSCDFLWKQQAPTEPDSWAVPLPGSYAAGSAGYILGHSSSTDPWVTPLPGSYPVGSAGYILGTPEADIWKTFLPGAYTAGQAGYIVGTNLDEKVSAGAGNVNVISWNGITVQSGSGTLPLVTTVPAGVPLQVRFPPVQTVNVTVVQGDDYSNADGRALIWTSSIQNAWPNLTGASVEWNVSDGMLIVLGTVMTPTGMQQVMAEPTAAETQVLDGGQYSYDVTATLASGHKVTLIEGVLTVADSERTATLT